jgi:cell fate regulator YaaT (PSP1 superfamily)
MEKVVGVRFKSAGKIYDFSCGNFDLDVGDPVIVETEQGLGFARVASSPIPVEQRQSKSPLKRVFRVADVKDFEQRKQNHQTEKEAHDFCLQCIDDLKLKMNLFSVESAFDASKLTFFFTAEGRVDFRQLVKLLVKQFRVRIEMRQVGIRNQARMCGGIGRCGREICCAAYMDKFEPVSIRMAKEQGLSLNPTKISGLCGRLMCCLLFENDTYIQLKREFPRLGTTVITERGEGRLIRQNILQNRVTVKLNDNTELETDLSQITTKKEKENQ